ncbi:MAG: hypothetical protein ACPIOQ_81870, partial [Promethearchaeia archaeon]
MEEVQQVLTSSHTKFRAELMKVVEQRLAAVESKAQEETKTEGEQGLAAAAAVQSDLERALMEKVQQKLTASLTQARAELMKEVAKSVDIKSLLKRLEALEEKVSADAGGMRQQVNEFIIGAGSQVDQAVLRGAAYFEKWLWELGQLRTDLDQAKEDAASDVADAKAEAQEGLKKVKEELSKEIVTSAEEISSENVTAIGFLSSELMGKLQQLETQAENAMLSCLERGDALQESFEQSGMSIKHEVEEKINEAERKAESALSASQSATSAATKEMREACTKLASRTDELEKVGMSAADEVNSVKQRLMKVEGKVKAGGKA